MKKALIRFNTLHNNHTGVWRVIFCDEDNVERLYDHVVMDCKVETVSSVLPGRGLKHHVQALFHHYVVIGSTIHFQGR